MTTYTDPNSGLALPCRRKPEPKREPNSIGCESVGCIFWTNRASGTTGICHCLSRMGATDGEREIIEEAMSHMT